MKSILTITLGFIIALASAFPVSAFENEISVILARRPVVFTDQAPVVIDGQLLVPLRALFEALRFDVSWNDGQITLNGIDTVITLTIGSDTFETSGREYRMNSPAQIIGNSTMVSTESMLDYLGLRHAWDGSVFEIGIPSSPSGTYDLLYVVRAGDTLSRIAAMFYHNIDDIWEGVELIMKANNMDQPILHVGQVLIIPEKP